MACRDEAEVRGHRRTYVGSLPGRIIQGIKKAGTNNPVFVLDEIDKLGHDFRGDPASALLEVLDPEQNHNFSDHYLEVTFDLSKVMFIATANQLDPIPWALRDRLEIIELPGYTRQEKRHISRQFLVPKQLEEHGLEDERCEIGDEALFTIIDHYTREAGVRNLEREVGSLCRGVAVKVAEGSAKPKESITNAEEVADYLGPQRFVSEVADRTAEPGVATGLAWTSVGGDILFIEATRMPGKGKLTLTGQLGDVMKESVTAALSFIRSRAPQLGLDAGNLIENTDIHVHVPAGGIPKDGPSAGVTMYTALVSLFLNTPVRPDIAMTGEITLRGNVFARWRDQGEAARRPPGRSQARDHSRAERQRPGRCARRDQKRAGDPSGQAHGRGPAQCTFGRARRAQEAPGSRDPARDAPHRAPSGRIRYRRKDPPGLVSAPGRLRGPSGALPILTDKGSAPCWRLPDEPRSRPAIGNAIRKARRSDSSDLGYQQTQFES